MACLFGTGLAQTVTPAKPLPVIRGQVQDAGGKGLEGAQVEIVGLGRSVTAGAGGSYRLDGITPGKYWVVARRIGYAPLRSALTLNPGDDREVVFQLERGSQMLSEESVTANDTRWSRRFNDFVWRSRSVQGRFLTRDDLQRVEGRYLDQAVGRFMAGVQSFGMNAISLGSIWPRDYRRGEYTGGGCAPVVSLNGSQPLGGWRLSDFRTEDVEAVELYSFTRTLPIEFQRWGGQCGLAVVWTR
jgi:hypothetical protein